MHPKRILVGLDGSDHEGAILSAALDMAKEHGSQLLLFHAVGLQPEVPPGALALSPDGVAELMAGTARDHLRSLATQVPADRLAGCVTEFGTPWRAICDVAKTHGADLIVIGAHHYGGLDRILGTTAAKVVNHADRSVLVVHPGE